MQSSGDENKRKTLVERARETAVRDPAAHARHQVVELDKTAKAALNQRRKCTEQIESDNAEILQIEHQIEMLKERYDPLCEHLADARERKKALEKMLDHCIVESKTIMGETKATIQNRRMEDSKFSKKMGSLELEILRGYNLRPESTFHQSNRMDSSSLENSKNSSSLIRAHNTAERLRMSGSKLGSSMKSLPPVRATGGDAARSMKKNNSSMI